MAFVPITIQMDSNTLVYHMLYGIWQIAKIPKQKTKMDPKTHDRVSPIASDFTYSISNSFFPPTANHKPTGIYCSKGNNNLANQLTG